MYKCRLFDDKLKVEDMMIIWMNSKKIVKKENTLYFQTYLYFIFRKEFLLQAKKNGCFQVILNFKNLFKFNKKVIRSKLN